MTKEEAEEDRKEIIRQLREEMTARDMTIEAHYYELREKIAKENNWKKQEDHWASQDRQWFWQRLLWIGVVVLGSLGIIFR